MFQNKQAKDFSPQLGSNPLSDNTHSEEDELNDMIEPNHFDYTFKKPKQLLSKRSRRSSFVKTPKGSYFNLPMNDRRQSPIKTPNFQQFGPSRKTTMDNVLNIRMINTESPKPSDMF